MKSVDSIFANDTRGTLGLDDGASLSAWLDDFKQDDENALD